MASGLSLVLALALGAPATDSSERVVTKASVYLAKDPSFLSPRASPTALQRGDKVKVEGEPKGAWLKVSLKKRGAGKLQGYLHVSSLSDRPVAFRAEDKDVKGGVKVSGNYNLAVPGFSAEVAQRREASQKDAKKGYALVSRYMPMKPKQAALGDPKTLLAFGTAGRLREPGSDVVLGVPPPEAAPAATETAPATPVVETPAAAVGATSPAAAAATSQEKRPAPAPVPAGSGSPAPAPVAAPATGVVPAPAAGVEGAPTGPASDPSEWTSP